MARFYSDENVPLPVVQELRSLGHDVLTSFDAGNANRSVPDRELLEFAVSQRRILVTLNRRTLSERTRPGYQGIGELWSAHSTRISEVKPDAFTKRLR
jgi:hypothetical protein